MGAEFVDEALGGSHPRKGDRASDRWLELVHWVDQHSHGGACVGSLDSRDDNQEEFRGGESALYLRIGECNDFGLGACVHLQFVVGFQMVNGVGSYATLGPYIPNFIIIAFQEYPDDFEPHVLSVQVRVGAERDIIAGSL